MSSKPPSKAQERGHTCQFCAFWDRVSPALGLCHRMPPVILGNDIKTATSIWPVCIADAWCGEFQPVSILEVPKGALASLKGN